MRLYQYDVSGLLLHFNNHFNIGANNAPVGFAVDTLTHDTPTDARDSTDTISSRPGERFQVYNPRPKRRNFN